MLQMTLFHCVNCNAHYLVKLINVVAQDLKILPVLLRDPDLRLGFIIVVYNYIAYCIIILHIVPCMASNHPPCGPQRASPAVMMGCHHPQIPKYQQTPPHCKALGLCSLQRAGKRPQTPYWQALPQHHTRRWRQQCTNAVDSPSLQCAGQLPPPPGRSGASRKCRSCESVGWLRR